MVASPSELLLNKIQEWLTGRKIGITVGVDPSAPDGQRGGELWQIPIVEATGMPSIQLTKFPMEYGKTYTDNIIIEPTIVEMRAFITNGWVSQLATNALGIVGDKLGVDWFKNSIFSAIDRLQKMIEQPIFCDITTNIKVYKNMKLIKAPTRETSEMGADNIELPLTFQEIQLFNPDDFVASKVTYNKATAGNRAKTQQAQSNLCQCNSVNNSKNVDGSWKFV